MILPQKAGRTLFNRPSLPMIQACIPQFGSPKVFRIEEVPDPMPGKREVRVAVRASGVNFADILARKGLYPDAPKPLPIVVGYEVSGVVDAIGEGISDDLLGKEVIALTRFRGNATKVCVPESAIFPKSKEIGFEQAAAIPVNYLTAWQLMVVMGSLSADETVLIHNAGGGVGMAAIQIGKKIGATMIGTASPAKHERLKAIGLHHAVDYRNANWPQVVSSLTNGKGVELILDPIGGSYWKKNYQLLRPTGRLGMFGVSEVTASRLPGMLRFIPVLLKAPLWSPLSLLENRGAFGVNMGHLWGEQTKVAAWGHALMKGVEEGWLAPHVDRTFPLADIAEAHQYIEDRKNFGKVVLTCT